jgi:YVTN family beta-propeller protein
MRTRHPLADAAAIAIAVSLVPLASPDSALATTAPAPVAYVVNSGSSSVDAIDTATNTVTATIKVGADPTGIVITRDGSTAYVLSANGIDPISTATNTPSKVIDPGATSIALDPDGYILYALNAHSDSVTLINVTTGQVHKPIKVNGSPDAIAFTPKGRIAYITTTSPATVISIPTATRKIRSIEKIGGHPTGIALSGSGEEAYVIDGGKVIHIHTATNSASGPIATGDYVVRTNITGFVLALSGSSIFVISIETGPTTPVAVGTDPDEIVTGLSGELAYTVNKGSDTITPIHIHKFLPYSLSAGTPIAVGNAPVAAAATPGGKTLYVTNSSGGTVTPVNIKTGLAGTPITVGSGPGAIAIAP